MAADRTHQMPNERSMLCIVPLSPPITGASLISENIVNYLRRSSNILTIAYQRRKLGSGTFSTSQVFRVLKCTLKLLYYRFFKKFETVYFVISSSRWGNIRDLIFLAAMGRNLRRKLVIHLHGANFDTLMQEASTQRRFFNRILYRNIKTAIVLGELFENIFDGYVSRNKVKVIKNYFDPSLLITESKVHVKFERLGQVNILYLSNIMKEKGWSHLLNAFMLLPEEVRRKANLHFAGTIHHRDRTEFLSKVGAVPYIFYHGIVSGSAKRDLLWQSHVFCLPTVYRFEGQPISILEAYASGCYVLTTRNGGIKDIFVDGSNGHIIDNSLTIDDSEFAVLLQHVISNIQKYKDIALNNRLEAMDKYSKNRYLQAIKTTIVDADNTAFP
jgi:glycosyltransferase involved in cell wall biosynthesis